LIILSEIEKDNAISRQKHSNLTGRSVRSIQRTLDSLKEKGILQRTGSTRNGSWLVIQKQ